jgi:hypothetical protein
MPYLKQLTLQRHLNDRMLDRRQVKASYISYVGLRPYFSGREGPDIAWGRAWTGVQSEPIAVRNSLYNALLTSADSEQSRSRSPPPRSNPYHCFPAFSLLSILKTEAGSSSETVLPIYPDTWRHIPEESNNDCELIYSSLCGSSLLAMGLTIFQPVCHFRISWRTLHYSGVEGGYR